MNDVFISYSRRDKVFTQKLYEALTAANRSVWADWDSIPAASDWDAEIKQGIQETHSVLFVLSPEWIKSNECRKELVHAVAMGKRLFPILYLPVDPNDVPPELAKINWVYIRDSDDFDKAFQTLCSAMDTDLDWIKTHTRIQIRALEWDRKKRDHSFVLRGNDLTDGEQFIAGAANKNPVPTPLQSEYILASRTDATRRQRQILGGVTVALVISIILGIVAFFQRQEAVRQSQISLARLLAALAQPLPNRETATLLAIQSMRLFPTVESAQVLQTNTLARSIASETYDGYASDAAFSPDGKYVVSTGCDKLDANNLCIQSTVRIIVAKTGEENSRTTFDGAMSSVLFSPDGKHIISSGCDKQDVNLNCLQGTVQAWGLDLEKEISHVVNNGAVSPIAVSPDGEYIVSSGCDKLDKNNYCIQSSVRVWNASTGTEITRWTDSYPEFPDFLPRFYSVAFSPDGKYIASVGFDLRVWEANTGKEVFREEGTRLSVAFSSNGEYIAAGGIGVATVWITETGEVVSQYKYDSEVGVWSIAVSPDGKYVAARDGFSPGTGGSPNTFTTRVWETLTGKEVTLIKHDKAYGGSVAFSPDGRYIVSNGGHTAGIWEATTGKEVAHIEIETGKDSYVRSAIFSPDGKYVISVGGNFVDVWDVGQQVSRMTHENGVNFAIFSPDGKHVISYECSKTVFDEGTNCVQSLIHIWDAATRKELNHITIDGWVYSFTLSKDGKYAVTGAINGDDCVWEIPTRKKISCFATKSPVPFVAISPDGKLVISRSDDYSAHVWKAITGQEVSRITYNDSDVRSFAFSPDSKYIVTAGCDKVEPVDKMGCIQSSVIIWAADTGKEVARKTYDLWELPVTFSPDGKYVVSGGYVWEPTTGKELAHIEACNYCDLLDISPDGKFIVTANFATAQVWEISTGKEIAHTTHDDAIWYLAFSPDGKYVLSGGADNIIRVWESSTGKEVTRITSETGFSSAAFSPNGKNVLWASDKTIQLYLWHPDDLIDESCSRITRNLTRAEWAQFIGDAMPYQAVCENLPIEPEVTITPTATP